MRKLPYPKIKPNASATIKAAGDITVNGAETEHLWQGDVIYNEHAQWEQDTNGKRIVSLGKIFIFHDVFPGLEHLTGLVKIKGAEYTFSGSRLYNPDGTVHHVELRLK